MLLLELLSLQFPYFDVNVLDVPTTLKAGKLPQIPNVPPFSETIPLCLNFDPIQRPSAKELLMIFEKLKEDECT